MSDDFRRQMRANFEEKDTLELLSIWQANNRADWSDLAFEVIEEILRERLAELPAQDAPAYEHQPVEVEEQEEEEEDVSPASPLYPYLCRENATRRSYTGRGTCCGWSAG